MLREHGLTSHEQESYLTVIIYLLLLFLLLKVDFYSIQYLLITVSPPDIPPRVPLYLLSNKDPHPFCLLRKKHLRDNNKTKNNTIK